VASPVREGEILAGKYRVERVLGQGGMGVVVAARHAELDELVALKFLLPEALSEPEAVARFLKEARAAVRIKSEHVARVHDVGQLDSGAPYIVMEYLEGSDLGAILHTRGPLPVDDAVDYVLQACEAIANAHVLGIVHRDLKPSNLMLVSLSDGSACVKVLDFGISKIAARDGRESAMNMTRTAAVLGSPLYMSPEQMMSAKDVDARTDIWALGTILYEILAGRPPFVADTLPALGVLIATTPAEPIRDVRPDVAPGLEAVVARCLAKSRDERFANVAEVAEALAPFAPERSRVSIERTSRILQASGGGRFERTPAKPLKSQSTRGATPVPGMRTATALPHAGNTATASNWGRTAGGGASRRQIATVLVALAALLTMASLVAFLAFGRRSPPAPASSATAPPSAAALPPPTPLPTLTPQQEPPPAPRAEPSLEETQEPPGTVRQPGHSRTIPPAVANRPAAAGAAKPIPATGSKGAYDDM